MWSSRHVFCKKENLNQKPLKKKEKEKKEMSDDNAVLFFSHLYFSIINASTSY